MSRAWPVQDIDPEASLAENARRILTVRMGEFYSYEPVIPIEDAIEPLHNMRIAAKRLRYTLELFEVVFGDLGKRQIERVKAVQEDLGTLHDFDVRIHLIEDELRALTEEEIADSDGGADRASADDSDTSPDVRRGLRKLLAGERAARRDRYRAFVSRWDQLRQEGMRGDLARLSSSVDVTVPDSPTAAPQTDAEDDDTNLPAADNGLVAHEEVAAKPIRYSAAF